MTIPFRGPSLGAMSSVSYEYAEKALLLRPTSKDQRMPGMICDQGPETREQRKKSHAQSAVFV
ncbi:hypothetical protein D8666_22540 [Ochrobactrum soli]|nr:hypothetical protein D8666_22540 [[Ochrobactrum] soli]